MAIESATKPRRLADAAPPQPTPFLMAEAASSVALPIDAVADAAVQARAASAELRCDVCDALIEDEPSGRGLYMWTRGDEVRFEEPALCSLCATAIGVTALAAWTIEEEEG